MKLASLLEDQRPLLLDLIQQRLTKGEVVRLNFWTPAARGSAMDLVQGIISSVDGMSVYFTPPNRSVTKRFWFGQNADEKLELNRKDGGWEVTNTKTSLIDESEGGSLLRTLIQQRLDKSEPVKLDFDWAPVNQVHITRYRGYVQDIVGNTLHTRYVTHGNNYTERFVLPPNVDDLLTLQKDGAGWLVKKI